MQVLRSFFAFLRQVIAGMRSVVISYGKYLEATHVASRPARKAHSKRKPASPAKRSRNE